MSSKEAEVTKKGAIGINGLGKTLKGEKNEKDESIHRHHSKATRAENKLRATLTRSRALHRKAKVPQNENKEESVMIMIDQIVKLKIAMNELEIETAEGVGE